MSRIRRAARAIAVAAALAAPVAVVAIGSRVVAAPGGPPEFSIKVTTANVVRGYFPRNAPPVLTVPDGAIVHIDTLSHSGLSNPDPVTFMGNLGIPANLVLPEATDIFFNEPRITGSSVHILTGPIYIEGAEPGDTLEIRILDVKPRTTWGLNSQSSGGALPGYLSASTVKLYRVKGNTTDFNDEIEIPLKPFQGIMGVASADDYVSPLPESVAAGIVSSRPPAIWGGNMDTNDLGKGTSLYLPVFQTGGQFFTGDPHFVQGNGEVSGNALEGSNTVSVQFVVHKDGNLTAPRAETPTHFITMGIDVDHDEAMRKALREALDFLVDEKGLTKVDAMSFASLAVDFNIAESVDFTQLVMGRIPKRFFLDDYNAKPRFWHHKEVKVGSEQQRQGLEAAK